MCIINTKINRKVGELDEPIVLPCKDCLVLACCRGYAFTILKIEWDIRNQEAIEDEINPYDSWMELIESDPQYYYDFFQSIRDDFSNKCKLIADYIDGTKTNDWFEREVAFDKFIPGKSMNLEE